MADIKPKDETIESIKMGKMRQTALLKLSYLASKDFMGLQTMMLTLQKVYDKIQLCQIYQKFRRYKLKCDMYSLMDIDIPQNDDD